MVTLFKWSYIAFMRLLGYCVSSSAVYSCVVSWLYFFSFCKHHAGNERAGLFALIVVLISCGCLCYMSLHRGAMGWSAIFDCVISSLTFSKYIFGSLSRLLVV